MYSSIGYAYQSIPLNWELGFRNAVRVGYTRRSSSYVYDSYYSGPNHGDGNTSESNLVRGIMVSPRVGVTTYLTGDLFMTSAFAVEFDYRLNDRHRETASHWTYWFDSITSASRQIVDADRYDLFGNTSVSAGFGWGRLYSGKYAFTALSLVRELKSAGLLRQEPSPDEMQALCDTVLEYRQRHVFDTRLRRIDALRSILKYLQAINAISNDHDYTPFIVADVWDYFPRDPRSFGFLLSTGVRLNYYSKFGHEEAKTEVSGHVTDSSTREEKHNRGTVAFRQIIAYYHPIDYHWQFDGQMTVWYIANNFIEDGFDYLISNDRGYWAHSLYASINYYRDSRTMVSARAKWEENLLRYSAPDFNTRDILVDLEAAVSYRLSVPTTVSIGISSTWQRITEDLVYSRQKDHFYLLSARISHWLY